MLAGRPGLGTWVQAAGRLAAGVLCCQLLLGAESGVNAEDRRGVSVDFLNDRLRIPDSERFREADYIESGVGLTFGVDRRLSYLSGNYEEAVDRFEDAVKRFRYKAEIWVFLARSYLYMKSPEEAKRALARAAVLMPDLSERLWDPLLQSLLAEIRTRANNLQTQVDFYSMGQGDFLSLFRLYTFLEDYTAAAGVISSASGKAATMEQLATTVSGGNQRALRDEARKWRDLASQLTSELEALGVDVPALPAPVDSASSAAVATDQVLLEATRLLQRRVEYYEPSVGDFEQLFTSYLELGMPGLAAGVTREVRREMQRLQLQADVTPDVQQEEQFLVRIDSLEAMARRFESELQGDEAPAQQ